AGSSFIGKREAYEGRNLQLPIYALAVERCLLPGASVKEGNYLSVSSGRSIGSLKFDEGGDGAGRFAGSRRDSGARTVPSETHADYADDTSPDLRTLTESFVLDYVEQLSRGVFTVQPSSPSVCGSCDHSRVCRITELRGAGERYDVTD
ncbi:MAG: PD-(D/E)XK nuclease family protein, partial [Cyanobacteria bacterium]|nr:PD-(D/E)XK nuclease family protein [Cyanobacteriota bacterium]